MEMTNTYRSTADKAAIGLSLLCALHCLALPLFLSLFPALVAIGFQDERFHLLMLISVVPMSLFALTLGCRQHRSFYVLGTGGLGILFLIASVGLGHDLLGESGETVMTLIGATLVSVSHVLNFKLCRSVEPGECADERC
jgi:hypothetical protein